MLIDVLIVKKDFNEPMEKNIGRIFRKYNIVEYKSPKEYLNIDDFYKVYGYACFYKTNVAHVDSIKVDEITLTFVCKGYPRKLMQHLTAVRGFEGELFEVGMCEAIIDLFRDEYDKGVEDAKQQGVQQGALQQMISLVRDGLLTIEVAIQHSGLSEEEFRKTMEIA